MTAMDSDFPDLEEAARWLRDARKVVVFTGAGISAESGIPTFRDADGLWQEFPPEQFGHWRRILRNALWRPRRIARFVRAVIEPIAAARPNAGHLAIAELERHVCVSVVTQNIDGLHQAAGNTIVHEVHGSLLETCTLRGRFVELIDRRRLQQMVSRLANAERSWLAHARLTLAIRPLMGIGWRGIYRPAVVMFGEALCEPAWTSAQRAAQECDVLICVGTSSMVLPAALLPLMAAEGGAKVITIDPDGGDSDISLRGKAGEILPHLVRAAFAGD
jgi:NAD-dependent deacetylase